MEIHGHGVALQPALSLVLFVVSGGGLRDLSAQTGVPVISVALLCFGWLMGVCINTSLSMGLLLCLCFV